MSHLKSAIAAAVLAANIGMLLAPDAAITIAVAAPPGIPDEPIYGYRLMTPQERDEYRTRLRNARTTSECQHIRDDHHSAMQARARERGVTLPDYTPQGRGMSGHGMEGPMMGQSDGHMGPPSYDPGDPCGGRPGGPRGPGPGGPAGQR
jgi:hypothetical protein